MAKWIYPLLVILALAVFAPVFQADFVNYDDDFYYTANAQVRAPLSFQTVRWAFTSVYFNNWHPLTWLSHAVDHHFFGLNPRGPHTVNLFLHVLNTLLVFSLFRAAAAGKDRATAAAGLLAALFAVHPLHVESVAWISDRKDLLGGFFGLLAARLYLAYVRKPSPGIYAGVAACMILSLMSKSMLVTLPLLLLIMDYWPLRRKKGWLPVLEKLPILFLSLVFGVVAMSLKTEQTESAWNRLLYVPIAYVRYLYKTFWPVDLAVYYPFPASPVSPFGLFLCIAGLAAVTVLVFLLRFRHPYMLAGWLWFAIALAPASGAIQIGGHCMADRYMYLPLIGLLMMMAWPLAHLSKRAVAMGAGMAMVFACSVLGFAQARTWRDSVSLWEQAIRATGSNGRAEYNLGNAWLERGELDKAAACYARALALDETDMDACTNLGVIAVRKELFDDAARWFQRALQISPENPRANQEVDRLAKLRANRGVAFAEQGRFDNAAEELRAALALRPHSADAHFNLANVLLRKGDFHAAAGEFAAALAIKPDDAGAHYALGLTLGHLGRTEDALAHFQQALRLRPGDPEILRQLKALQP